MTLLEISGTITALTIIGGIMFAAFKKNKKIEDNNTDIISMKTDLNKLIDSFNTHSLKTDLLLREFKPNGGSSLKDSLNRLEKGLTSVEKNVTNIAIQSEFNKATINSIISNSPNSGYIITNEIGETVEVSLSVCRLLQRQESELLHRKWVSFIHPLDKDRVLKALQEASITENDMKEEWRMELPIRGKKQYIRISNFAKRIYSNNKFVGYYITVTEVN